VRPPQTPTKRIQSTSLNRPSGLWKSFRLFVWRGRHCLACPDPWAIMSSSSPRIRWLASRLRLDVHLYRSLIRARQLNDKRKSAGIGHRHEPLPGLVPNGKYVKAVSPGPFESQSQDARAIRLATADNGVRRCDCRAAVDRRAGVSVQNQNRKCQRRDRLREMKGRSERRSCFPNANLRSVTASACRNQPHAAEQGDSVSHRNRIASEHLGRVRTPRHYRATRHSAECAIEFPPRRSSDDRALADAY